MKIEKKFKRLFFLSLWILAAPIYSNEISPETQVELAKRYYSSQEHEKAIETYLKALKTKPPQTRPHLLQNEEKAYEKALRLYLEAKGTKTQENSALLIKDFAPLISEHPEYSQLTYIVAAAYANVGNFPQLFDLFYRAYEQNPCHFLAYKTQAILWIKLFERDLPGSSKELKREQILENLYQASEAYPYDTSLYRLMILYSSEQSRPDAVLEGLNKIISKDIVIPRGELEFYMKHALSLNDKSHALQLIDKASIWYPYSRTVEKAKSEINSLK